MFHFCFYYGKILMVRDMSELIEKIEELKKELDQLEVFDELKLLQKQIYCNSELVDKIKKYNETINQSLRLDIYQYDEMKQYKKIENEINLIILEINQRLNLITDKRGCHHASN